MNKCHSFMNGHISSYFIWHLETYANSMGYKDILIKSDPLLCMFVFATVSKLYLINFDIQ